jgi:GntR family transcriptional regulator/MocR family aminotransferase
VRKRNAARRVALLAAIDDHLRERVEVTGYGAGAHVVLWPTTRFSEDVLIARAANRSVGVYGVAPYFLTRPARKGLVLGYSRLTEADIREGVRRLSGVL